MNGNDFSGILVFSENENIVLELLSKGRELADKLGTPLNTIILNTDNDELAKTMIAHGADNVYKLTPGIEIINTEKYVEVLYKFTNELKPKIILLGSNRIGKELSPRLASRFNTGSAADCISADLVA